MVAVGQDWEVAILELVPDAGEQVAAANEFNDPPVEGRQFVMARFLVRYVVRNLAHRGWS